MSKFIVFYGINNLGKSTQSQMLADRLIALGHQAEGHKYAVYHLRPTGLNIDSILRGKRLKEDHGLINAEIAEMHRLYHAYYRERPDLIEKLINERYGEVTAEELQWLQVKNREQFEPTLREKLQAGVIIVAEDYLGTGIAWGMTFGVDQGWLERANAHLLKPDLAILFDGQRFVDGIEAKHRHEANNPAIEKCRLIHLQLAKQYGWPIINANQPKETIAEAIWQLALPILPKR